MNIRSYFLSLVLLLGGVSYAGAESVAVFPLEDLSQGKNSVNVEFTDYLSQILQTKGYEVISDTRVISFMAQNRIRWVGHLDTEHVLMAKEELGVDFLLFGTICQRRAGVLPAIGLTLYLVRTSDAETVWSDSGGLSTADVQKLLGLAEPQTVEELLPLLAEQVMVSWPEVLDPADSASREYGETNAIESVTLAPRYLRPGEEVRCKIRLKPTAQDGVQPAVYLKVAGRVYLAQAMPVNQEYEAAWIGSEGKTPGPVVTHLDINLAALNADNSSLFESIWIEQDEDAHYPVNLVLNWPSGQQEVFFVGTYVVDSRVSSVSVELIGEKINGIVTFKDKVNIIPHLVEREQLSHWQIAVENMDGQVIASEEGDGNLPYRFAWQGQLNTGQPAKEGRYEIVLSIWDRAGNMGRASQSVYFVTTSPVLELQATKQQGKMLLDIQHEGVVPLDYWYLEIWSDQEVLLKVVEGEELPATVEVTLSQLPESCKMKGYLFAKDILGSQSKQEIRDLSQLAEQAKADDAETEVDQPRSDGWNAEF